MKQLPPFLFLCICLSQAACQSQERASRPELPTSTEANPGERSVGGPCECCSAWADGIPQSLSWETRICGPDEPGEPLEISGVIFQPDGETPAKDIILYVYHTDAAGLYSDGPTISTCAGRHGHLRGWMKTGSDGRYKFLTIRPASYPNTTIEQHIHPIVKEPGLQAYWIDEFLFDDDPNLTANIRNSQSGRGGSGILHLNQTPQGIWLGNRNIILGRNIPGY